MSERIFINPGGIYFGRGDLNIETLLGSCVAIVFWHPQQRLGGLCHFVLPARVRASLAGQPPLDGRYGEEAVRQILSDIKRHGTDVRDYTVKVFGGGRVLDLPESDERVGQINARFALEILKRQNIEVKARDIAGEGYRYLRFDLSTGDVWVRRGHGVMKETQIMHDAVVTRDIL